MPLAQLLQCGTRHNQGPPLLLQLAQLATLSISRKHYQKALPEMLKEISILQFSELSSLSLVG